MKNAKETETQTEFVSDPKTFAECSAPFGTAEGLKLAFEGFHQELRELRKKWRIANVHVVVEDSYLCDELTPMPTLFCIDFGDASKWEGMAAYGFGKESQSREEMVAQLLATGRGKKK